MPLVQSLFVYPVKSCAGIELDHATVLPTGLEYDRQWMVIDQDRLFLSQRELPRMAHIIPTLESGRLTLHAPGHPSITLTDLADPERYDAQVWESVVAVLDEGDQVADWLKNVLGREVRLVRMAPGTIRRVNPEFARTPNDHVQFVDGYPILVILQDSLDDLNKRMPDPLTMKRFRPNIVLSGADAYADDFWETLSFPELSIDLVKPSSRCAITQIDPETLAIGKDPLKTLAGYRRLGSKVLFGWNAIPHASGSVTIGQSFDVTKTRPSLFA